MPPPGIMQRNMGSHIGVPNQQQQQQQLPMVAGPGPSGHLLPMGEWGTRYPSQQNARPSNQSSMMQTPISMQQQQQQVSFFYI